MTTPYARMLETRTNEINGLWCMLIAGALDLSLSDPYKINRLRSVRIAYG